MNNKNNEKKYSFQPVRGGDRPHHSPYGSATGKPAPDHTGIQRFSLQTDHAGFWAHMPRWAGLYLYGGQGDCHPMVEEQSKFLHFFINYSIICISIPAAFHHKYHIGDGPNLPIYLFHICFLWYGYIIHCKYIPHIVWIMHIDIFHLSTDMGLSRKYWPFKTCIHY